MQSEALLSDVHNKRLLPAFWICVWMILGVAGVLQVASASQEAATLDEATHLAAGYSYWKTGDYRLNAEHPPLSKLLASIPLLWLRPDFSPSQATWEIADEFPLGKDFLYKNRIPADTMLAAARGVTTLLSLLLVLSVAWWTGRIAGPLSGIAAALLLAFEPTVIAHSRYVTADIPVTLFMWLSCISWYSYLERPARWVLVRTGLLAGLALATKFNALLLFVIFGLLWVARARMVGSIPASASGTFGKLLVLSVLVVLCAYSFQTLSVADEPALRTRLLKARLLKAYPDDGSTRSLVVQTVLHVPVPGYYFPRGLHLLIRHNQSGHPTYLLGNVSTHGSWLYFPVAMLVKSATAWLLLAFAAFGVALAQAVRRGHGRDAAWSRTSLLLPVGLYFLMSITSSINIGLRHLLPIYPFLAAFVAVVLFGRFHRAVWLRIAAFICVLCFLAESATVFPRYLSYFNMAAGGSRNGARFLLDSNIDWGQDLKRLKIWTQNRQSGPLCLDYFGVADPAYYSIEHRPLMPVRSPEERDALNCVAAVSVQFLWGEAEPRYSALRELTPTDRVGDSIMIYDLRRNPGS